MSTFTPKRSLTRPRPSLSSGINTASSPSLSASYNAHQGSSLNSLRANGLLGRKASLSALTHGSLAAIPDASEGYGLSTVLDEDSPTTGRMGLVPHTPKQDHGDVRVGDKVDVPGEMHGTVKFVGSVQGKKGVFAGVELSEEFASRGKNSGDVDGVSYFRTSIEGAGIFLPISKAIKHNTPPNSTNSFPVTPNTPSVSGQRLGGPSTNSYTPPTPSLPKFSQSVGPGRAGSPQFKKTRPSLPRPESPLRKPQLVTPGPRPSINTPQPKGGIRYAPSPTPGKFGQSVRGTMDSRDPSKKPGNIGAKASVGPRSASALSQNPIGFSDDENTPIGTARTTDNGSIGSVTSFNAKMRPPELRSNDEEIARLRSQLEERDRQLKEQASSLAEMENSLAEVQSLMGGSDAGSRHNRNSLEDKDAAQLRAMLREKNEKIAMLTAEFDAHRADFRSTIDTLEMASTETERVYEKRVEDLVAELREYQDRSEDVDSVARQLKQLEELVQELEEGLEDARRGEAEARGEVEFLRGEVERGRSELRREREKAAAALNGSAQGANAEATAKEVEQRDDEIRGLKAIIHSLSRDAVPDNMDPQKTPTQRNGNFPRTRRTSQQSVDERVAREKLEREVTELRTLVEAKNSREDELERELERLRRGSAAVSIPNQRSSAMTVGSNGTIGPELSSMRDSKGTVISWRDREAPEQQHRRGNTLETMPESDTYSSATDGSALWCEICETGGHDILTCTNMFGSKQAAANGSSDYAVQGANSVNQRTGRDVVREGLKGLSPNMAGGDFAPAPLSPLKPKHGYRPPPVAIIPNPMDQGPVAGKESGVIDANKWCALCERDGHESVDCPFENVF